MVCVHIYSESDNALLRYGHLKFSKMAAERHLGFDPTGNGAVRSAVPENPTLEPNMKGSVEALQSYGHLKFSQNVRSVVGRRSSIFILLTLFSYTPLSLPYERIAREE